MRSAWFDRSIRTFSNVQRIPEGAGERILVIIGAGHVPVLRHLIEAAPE